MIAGALHHRATKKKMAQTVKMPGMGDIFLSLIMPILLGPFHGGIAVPSVMRCRRRRRGHRCAGVVRQWRQ